MAPLRCLEQARRPPLENHGHRNEGVQPTIDTGAGESENLYSSAWVRLEREGLWLEAAGRSNVSRGRMLPKGVDEETDERLQRRSDAINPSTEAAHQGAPTLAQLDESSEAIW